MEEYIEEKIEMNTRKVDYKGHVIWLSSYELKTGGWIPRALVVLPAEEGNGQQELLYLGEATFPVREEADMSEAFRQRVPGGELPPGQRVDHRSSQRSYASGVISARFGISPTRTR